jgi:NADPH:quinone reductase
MFELDGTSDEGEHPTNEPGGSVDPMTTARAPATMRALQFLGRAGELPKVALVERPVPTPRRGELLIRVAAAPINPNDILFLRDRYEIKKPPPVVPGFEGSGTVVGAGAGLLARTMLGRRVACAAGDGDGTWAEYVTVPVMRCAPLRGGVSLDEGATMLTNPLTALVLATRARREGHRAIVLTAAAGALGQMLSRLFSRQGQAVIHVVRKPSQVASLRADGAAHVLNSSADGFVEELRAISARLGVSLALDAVGGETTGQVLAALPAGSVVRVYGMLSDAACRVDPSEIVFHGKRLEGFTMYDWLRTTNVVAQLFAFMKVQGLVRDVLKTRVRERVPLADHERALTMAIEGASEGKVLLVP